MPLAVPLVMAAAEYGGSALLAGGTTAALGSAIAAAPIGTEVATAAEATALSAGSLSGLQLAGLGASTLSGVGQALSGQAQQKSAQYNAQIAANNAIIARQNATAASLEGESNAATESQHTKAQIGGILANQGASGVDVNSGSSLDVRSSAAQTGELNAINIRSQAARQAYGYQTEAVGDQGKEAMYKSEAAMAPIEAGITSAGTLLSGAVNPNNPFGAYLSSQSMGGY